MDLDQLWKRGREFLGVRLPIICGAMTWISDSDLVAAVSRTGAFASLAAGNLPPDLLEQEIQKTRRSTDKPFAIFTCLSTPGRVDPVNRSMVRGRVSSLPSRILFSSYPARTFQEIDLLNSFPKPAATAACSWA
ncbi:nitronate monooxygenase [Candidatus Zixiibacteriota bacterium]